ncbi:MAG: DUF1365 family protein [Thermoleophilaceae bacterium]
MSSELYEGWVRHRRLGAVEHSFRYRLYMTLSAEGPVRTLEMPRSLGVGFNPVRFRYRMEGDEVGSIAAEVTNTPWGERRTYEFEGRSGRAGKSLHVSPFLGMDHEYVFHATTPGERLTVHIESLHAGRRVFDATLSLQRRPASDLRRLRLRYPVQTVRVLGLIYGHAALLALRGARYHPHPGPAARRV